MTKKDNNQMKLSIVSALTALIISTTAQADDTRIKLPADYKSTFTNYLNLDRIQNDDQIIHLYANDIAMKGRDASGKFPNGSIVIGEVYKAKKDKNGDVIESELGQRIRGKLAVIAVMEKQEGWGKDFSEEHKNDDWDFAAFKPDGTDAKKDLNSCRACHAPLGEQDHLFSFEHIGQHIGR